MSKTHNNGNIMVVDLAEGVMIGILMPKDNLPALRSGFAGYPVNPRWNVVKYRAWKTGRQLRQSLDAGELVVRPNDSMLVPAHDSQCTTHRVSKQEYASAAHCPMVLA